MEEEKVMVIGVGMTALMALMAGLFKSDHGNGGEPPATDGVVIDGASWATVEYGFTDWWGESLTAFFYKAEIEVTSDTEFSGRMELHCPDTIAPVPLLSAQGYQDLLDEIDGLISDYSPGSHAREIWEARKQLALQFPQVDGFYIDHRWTSPENWEGNFREWMRRSTESITWEGIDIPEGESTVTVGFFKTHAAGVAQPVTIYLYDTGGQLFALYQVNLPGAEDAPSVQGLTLPQQVVSGQEYQAQLTVKVPEIFPGEQMTYVELSYAESSKYLASPYIANRLNNKIGRDVYIPLSSSDDVYTLTFDCQAVSRHGEPLIPGEYTLRATVSTWQVGFIDDRIYFYTDEPYSEDTFSDIGNLIVV